MHTKIGIVIDVMTGQVEWLVVPGDHPGYSEDAQLATHAGRVGPFKKMIIEPYDGPTDEASINAIVQRHMGKMMP